MHFSLHGNFQLQTVCHHPQQSEDGKSRSNLFNKRDNSYLIFIIMAYFNTKLTSFYATYNLAVSSHFSDQLDTVTQHIVVFHSFTEPFILSILQNVSWKMTHLGHQEIIKV